MYPQAPNFCSTAAANQKSVQVSQTQRTKRAGGASTVTRSPLLRNQCPHRLVVRTSRCGRDNPGSTPGVDILCCRLSLERKWRDQSFQCSTPAAAERGDRPRTYREASFHCFRRQRALVDCMPQTAMWRAHARLGQKSFRRLPLSAYSCRRRTYHVEVARSLMSSTVR